MSENLDLSVVIVSFNTKKLTINCLRSIFRYTKNINCEVIVVDNASTDGSREDLKKQKLQNKNLMVVFNERNLGFAAANNIGIKRSKGRYILLLNSDTLIRDNILREIVEWMDKNPKVGIATCALKNLDGSLQGTGGYFPSLIRVFSWMTIQDLPFVDHIIKPFHPMRSKSFSKGSAFYTKERELDWVTGAFFLFRREIVKDIGLLDEKYFMYVEEVDFCFRAKKKGWRVWYLPQWSIIHYGGASGTRELSVLAEFQGLKRFYKKHYPSWQYPFLRFFLKLGSLGRAILFGILEGKKSANIYVKAFRQA